MPKGKAAILAKVRKVLGAKRGAKKRSSSFARRDGHNPVMEFDYRSKIYPPLGHRFGVKQSFQSDPPGRSYTSRNGMYCANKPAVTGW